MPGLGRDRLSLEGTQLMTWIHWNSFILGAVSVFALPWLVVGAVFVVYGLQRGVRDTWHRARHRHAVTVFLRSLEPVR